VFVLRVMVVVSVMSGAAVGREAFVAAVADRVVSFSDIEIAERTTRRYADAAIIVGRTAMVGTFADTAFSLPSRYTHVFLRDGDDSWLLASAQGTPINETA
jgi:ketosteroid isomerase-like protein